MDPLRPPPTAFNFGTAPHACTGVAWPGTGETYILLHGFGGSGLDFEGLVPHLPVDANIIAFDIVGHGATSGPPDDAFSMTACVTRLRTGLECLPPGAHHLLGYSMGGRTALHLATTSSQPFASLTLIGATAGLSDPDARAERRAWDYEMANRARTLGAARFAAYWAALPLIRTQANIPPPWNARLRARRADADVEGLARSLEGMGTGTMPPVWEQLPSIQAPTLVIAGEHDPKYRRIADRLTAALPVGQKRVIAGTGHAPHLEAPAHFTALWTAWLDTLPTQ